MAPLRHSARAALRSLANLWRGPDGVGAGVAELADLERLRAEARRQDESEGNEVAGLELRPIEDGVRELSASELARRLGSSSPPLLIDVRPPERFAAGHLPGAWRHPVAGLAEAVGNLPDAGAVVYGDPQHRGVDGAYVLIQAGLGPVWCLAGDLAAWLHGELPLDR